MRTLSRAGFLRAASVSVWALAFRKKPPHGQPPPSQPPPEPPPDAAPIDTDGAVVGAVLFGDFIG